MGTSKRRIVDFDVEIGRRLCLYRTQRSMSQAALGNAIDVTFQQIQKYENGLNRISAGKLIYIARALDVPVSVFFEGLEDEADAARAATTASQQIATFANSSEGRRLCRAFLQIEKLSLRQQFVRLLESLSDHQDG